MMDKKRHYVGAINDFLETTYSKNNEVYKKMSIIELQACESKE